MSDLKKYETEFTFGQQAFHDGVHCPAAGNAANMNDAMVMMGWLNAAHNHYAKRPTWNMLIFVGVFAYIFGFTARHFMEYII